MTPFIAIVKVLVENAASGFSSERIVKARNKNTVSPSQYTLECDKNFNTKRGWQNLPLIRLVIDFVDVDNRGRSSDGIEIARP